MNKIRTIIRKEWAEVFKNRMVIFTVAFLPLLMTAIPLGDYLWHSRKFKCSSQYQFQWGTSTGNDPVHVSEWIERSGLFSGVPGQRVHDVVHAGAGGNSRYDSRVFNRGGEDDPQPGTTAGDANHHRGITDRKVPGGSHPCGDSDVWRIWDFRTWVPGSSSQIKTLLMALLDARWLVAIFIVGPLLAVMAVSFALMISSRVNDPTGGGTGFNGGHRTCAGWVLWSGCGIIRPEHEDYINCCVGHAGAGCAIALSDNTDIPARANSHPVEVKLMKKIQIAILLATILGYAVCR